MNGHNNQYMIIFFSSWSLKGANYCWSLSILSWLKRRAFLFVLGDWWNENFFFAQSCSPPDFVCFSMFPLWDELTQSAYLNKLSTTDPCKSHALASTQICCKYWVHTLHVHYIIITLYFNIKIITTTPLIKTFLWNSFFLFFFEGRGLLLFIFTVKILNLKINFMIETNKLTANSFFSTFN